MSKNYPLDGCVSIRESFPFLLDGVTDHISVALTPIASILASRLTEPNRGFGLPFLSRLLSRSSHLLRKSPRNHYSSSETKQTHASPTHRRLFCGNLKLFTENSCYCLNQIATQPLSRANYFVIHDKLTQVMTVIGKEQRFGSKRKRCQGDRSVHQLRFGLRRSVKIAIGAYLMKSDTTSRRPRQILWNGLTGR